MKWVVGAPRFDCNGLRVAGKGGAQQKLFALAAELRCTTKTGSFLPLTRLGDDSSEGRQGNSIFNHSYLIVSY